MKRIILFTTISICSFLLLSSMIGNKKKSEKGLPGVGMAAPEIAFPSPSGETLKLSTLKGNIVLLDFWASWCGPCVKKNPALNKIKADGLRWKYHVSDLKGWSSEAAQVYGVRSIPRTYLIDETGYIIALNPSDALIELELKKRLKAYKAK